MPNNKISQLSHVALLLPSVQLAAHFLSRRGISSQPAQTFPAEGTKEIYVGSYDTQSGLLLLLEPIAEGPYQKALLKRGPGLHHIAIDVLNMEEFILRAQGAGWSLHPVSAKTMAHGTAWLFCKGIPTLIEVQQQKEFSTKSALISKIQIPVLTEHLGLFQKIGLGEVVFNSEQVSLSIESQEIVFSEIALSACAQQ